MTKDEGATASAGIPLHDLLGLDADWEGGKADSAEVTMPVGPEAFGHTQNLHGGAIATMVDLACAVAAVRGTGFDPATESLVTTDMHVRFLGRPSDGSEEVVARATVVRAGSQLVVVECKVTDGTDHLVAAADVSLMKVTLRRPLSPDT